MRQTLIGRLAPRLTAPDALALVGAMDVALCELINRVGGRPAVLRASYSGLRNLVVRGQLLLGNNLKDLPPELPAATNSIEDLNHLNDRLRTCAVDFIEYVHDRSPTLTDADRITANQVIREMLQHQFEEMSAEMTAVPDEDLNQANPLAIDHEELANDIQAELGLQSAVRLDNVKCLSGGFSRVTLSVNWSTIDATGNLVIRKEKPAPIMENVALGVAGEFPVLRFLHSHGVAVPNALWLQTDQSVLGSDFMALEQVQGATLGSAMGAIGVTEDIVRQIAVQLALLHTVPWETNELTLARAFRLEPGKINCETALNTLLARWEARWSTARLRPSPALSAALCWLKRNKPRRDVRPCLLHGDIGFHNILFEEGTLTALLDWETAFLGDPAKDIATCQSFVGLYTDWDRFLDWYRAAGGPAVDVHAVRYYGVLRVFTQLLVGEIGLETKFAGDETSEIEYLFLGGPVRRYFYNDYLTCLDTISSRLYDNTNPARSHE